VGAHFGGDRFLSERPGVGCGAAILRDGLILLVERRKAPEAGHWNLPGGKVDFLERVEAAIMREMLEEVGIEIALGPLLCVTQMVGIDGQHWVSPVHRATIISGEPVNREPDKLSDIRWFALDAPPTPLAQGARDAIEALRVLAR
jgi:ADP-ribose pyrophosphatase YjhB (NUDIX family)